MIAELEQLIISKCIHTCSADPIGDEKKPSRGYNLFVWHVPLFDSLMPNV